MKALSITLIMFLLSGCDTFKTWSIFAVALQECEEYEKSIFSFGGAKDIVGLDDQGGCLVKFYSGVRKSTKYLSCKFDEKQRKEISKFLLEYDNLDISRSVTIKPNNPYWKFEFKIRNEIIENPIQRAIVDGSCNSKNS